MGGGGVKGQGRQLLRGHLGGTWPILLLGQQPIRYWHWVAPLSVHQQGRGNAGALANQAPLPSHQRIRGLSLVLVALATGMGGTGSGLD